jgi:ferredoxin-NADP reductase
MPEVRVTDIETVGDSVVAVKLETPPEFDADPGQFILVRATLSGETETSYYTLSAPRVGDTFEITVAINPDGTVGPWLAEKETGDSIEIEGPYGDIAYTGQKDALVLASGPGIGPAVGIGERAHEMDKNVTIIINNADPPHQTRLNSLENDGAKIVVRGSDEAMIDTPEARSDISVYVFGFQSFVEDARHSLTASGFEREDIEIENFGSE